MTPDPPLAALPTRILGVGIATLDLINEVERYPPEDAEVRALTQRRSRGGNAANTLAVLSDGRIAWLVGQRIDDRFKVTASTRRVARLRAGAEPPDNGYNG